MKKLFLPILLACSVSACATAPKKVPDPPKVVIQSTAPVVAPKVDPVVLQPVEWKVYNKDSLRELLARLDAAGENVVLFVLDGDQFKALSGNLSEIKRYISEKNEAFDYVMEAIKQDEPIPTARDK